LLAGATLTLIIKNFCAAVSSENAKQ